MTPAGSLGVRNVAYNTLVSKVPSPHVRARFQSLQSAVQHVSISVAGAIAGFVLSTATDGRLVGIPVLAYIAIGLSSIVPFIMWRVERRVRGVPAA